MRFFTLTSSLLLSSCLALSLAGCGSSDSPSGGTGGDMAPAPLEIKLAEGSRAVKPRFSPDSAKIAFGADTADTTNLVVTDTAGANLATLTPTDDSFNGAAWAPDGKQVYFASTTGIKVVGAEGGATKTAVTAFSAADPDVSADGKSLVYALNGGTLQLVDLANPTAPKDLGESGSAPRFSPDGKSIAFVSSEHIKTMELASGTVTDVVDADTYLAAVDWFSDGKRLAIVSKEGIEIVTLGATPSRTLVRDEFAAMDLDLSPDEKSMAYTVNGQKSLFVLTGF